MIAATKESVLVQLCQALLRHLGSNDGRLEIREVDDPASPGSASDKIFVVTTMLRLPCCGRTHAEAMGWMVAQAISHLGPNDPIAISTHDTLIEHSIVIPTRDEYNVALSKMMIPCDVINPP